MKSLRGIKPKVSRDSEPLTKAPPVPKHFDAYAREEWRRIMPRLIADGIVTRSDLGGIEDLCVMRGLCRQIETERAQNGGIIDKVQFGILNRAAQTARQLAAEYGLSPVSRARIASNATLDDDDGNPLAVT